MNSAPKKWLFAISIFAIAMGIYAYNPFGLFFLADDFLHIPESSKNVLLQRNSFRPIGNITLYIDYWLNKQNAIGYHITNLLLHITNCVLLYFVINKARNIFFKTSTSVFFAMLVALTFFVYPFHSEAVFWIIGRTGSLGCLFFLAAIYFLLSPNKISSIILSLIMFFLGLISYESVWIYPIISIGLLIIMQKQKIIVPKNLVIISIEIVSVFAVYLLLRFKFTQGLLSLYDTQAFSQFNVIAIAKNFITLITRTILPPMYNSNYLLAILVTIVVILVLVLQFIKAKKINYSIGLFLLGIWLCSYLPYLSIGVDTHGVEGERFLYLPSFLFIVWLLYTLQILLSKKYFFIAFVSIVFYNSYFLLQAKIYYAKASKITQYTLKAIKQTDSTTEKIFIKNLPQNFKGAVVFRSGLQQAVQWFVPTATNKICILSIDSTDEIPIKNFTQQFTIISATAIDTIAIHSFLVNDTTFKKNYLVKDTSNFYYLPKKHSLLTYSSSFIQIQ